MEKSFDENLQVFVKISNLYLEFVGKMLSTLMLNLCPFQTNDYNYQTQFSKLHIKVAGMKNILIH